MSGTPHGDDALNLQEAAAYLSITPDYLQAEYDRWELPPTRMAGRNYWFKHDLDAFKLRRVAEPYGAGVRYRVLPKSKAAA